MSDVTYPRVFVLPYWDYTVSPSDPFPSHYGQKVLNGTDFRVGSEDRRWRSKVRDHLNATGNLTAEKYSVHRKMGTATYFYIPKKRYYYVHGDMGRQANMVFISHDAQTFNNVRGLAVSRMLHNARQAQTGFSSGVFTGELRETIQFLRHPLRKFREFTNDTARKFSKSKNGIRSTIGSKKWRKQARKVASDTWLEYSFGISPLLSDLEAAKDTLCRPMHVYKRVSGRASLRVGTCSSPGEQDYSLGRTESVVSDVVIYSSRAIGEVGFAKGASARTHADWGLISSQFVPTLYELIPYSWLVDYFVNLGDIVEAVAGGSVPLTWACVTTRSRAIRVMSYQFLPDGGNLPISSASAGLITFERKRVVRNSNVGDGIPPLSWYIPNTVRQAANLAALAVSRLK